MTDSLWTADPYVYMGHINLYNKDEAGAELAVHLNKVMSHFHYKPGEPSGLFMQGKLQEDNYTNRMSNIGITTAPTGEELDRDPHRSPYRAQPIKKGVTQKKTSHNTHFKTR